MDDSIPKSSQNSEDHENINEIICMEEEPQQELQVIVTIDQDQDVDVDADSELISDSQENDNERTDPKDKLRGTKKTATMKQNKTTISAIQKLTKATQTEYLRGQINIGVNGMRFNEGNGERVAPMSCFQAFASYFLSIWESLWLP